MRSRIIGADGQTPNKFSLDPAPATGEGRQGSGRHRRGRGDPAGDSGLASEAMCSEGGPPARDNAQAVLSQPLRVNLTGRPPGFYPQTRRPLIVEAALFNIAVLQRVDMIPPDSSSSAPAATRPRGASSTPGGPERRCPGSAPTVGAAEGRAPSRRPSACVGAAVEAALDRLCREDSANAHGMVLEPRAAMLRANLAPATIDRALATLRSVSKLARMLGLVHRASYLEVPGVKAERRRDTRGPSVEDVRRMFEATAGDTETAPATTRSSQPCSASGSACRTLRARPRGDRPRPGHRMDSGKGRREKEPCRSPPSSSRRSAGISRTVARRPGAALCQSMNRPGRDASRRLLSRSVARLVADVGNGAGSGTSGRTG